MRFANIVRSGRVLVGAAATVLAGANCMAQQANATVAASASVRSDQVLPAGTVMSVGQGVYIVPALPPSATETHYALTGEGTPHRWQEVEGRWIGGVNGPLFLPPTP